MNNDDDSFLARWSKRKAAARTERAPQPNAPSTEVDALADGEPEADAIADAETKGRGADAKAGPRVLTEEDFADVDFDKLDYGSDYARFMEAGVPESVRGKALQKLWMSDEMFTAVDPFQDYAGDYTDAATVPVGVLKTSYRIGRGMLSEQESAEWEKLGLNGDAQAAIDDRVRITVAAETPDQDEIGAFFTASEAYMGALYPAESNHFMEVADLLKPNVLFLVARRRGAAIGCGALVRSDDNTAEIKRMWVDPDIRRERVGERLLTALEDAARGDGIEVVRLETGVNQPEAISLYRKFGFADCGPFGDYKSDPLSVFMEKRLIAAPATLPADPAISTA